MSRAFNPLVKSEGAVLEWLKRHAWKACIPQKGIPSSNLGRSAKMDGVFLRTAEVRTSRVRHRRKALA